MTKEAVAKFTSRCKACGGSINPGENITYDPSVKYSSRHTVCPTTIVTSNVPLNSPGRAALQGRGRRDFFLGEKSDIELAFTSESPASTSDLGHMIRAKDGRFLTCIGAASHYVSQGEADDFDLVGPSGSFSRHYSILRYYRIYTPEEAAACDSKIKAKDNQKRFEDLCNYGNNYPYGEAGRQIISSEEANAMGERTLIWKKTVGYSLHEGWRVDAGLLTHHPVYDDSPYWQIIRYSVMTPEDARVVREAAQI